MTTVCRPVELDIVRENFPTHWLWLLLKLSHEESRRQAGFRRYFRSHPWRSIIFFKTVRAQAEGIDISTADPTLINLLASTERN